MKYLKLFENFGSDDEKWDYFYNKIEKGDSIRTEEWQECPEDLQEQYIDMKLSTDPHKKSMWIYNKYGNNPKSIMDISSERVKQYYINKITKIGIWIDYNEFKKLNNSQKEKWFESRIDSRIGTIPTEIEKWFKDKPQYFYLMQKYEDFIQSFKKEIADTIDKHHGKEASKQAADYMGLQKHEYGSKEYSEMSPNELNDELNNALDRKDYETAKEISKYLKENKTYIKRYIK